jgi:hypothetical protein
MFSENLSMNNGGTAFPICPACSLKLPRKTKSSEKD